MKFNFKSVVAGAAALAVAGGLLITGAGAAQAATFDPDATQLGTLSFYDASGAQISGGTITDGPMAAFYKASGPKVDTFPFNNGYVAFFTPVAGQAPAAWQTGNQSTTGQNFATLQATYPAGLNNAATNVVIKGAAADGKLSGQVSGFPAADPANVGVYQIRLYTSASATTYFAASVTVSGTTWAQTFPALGAATATVTTLAAPTPASPVIVGAAPTVLSASVTASPTNPTNGSVVFKDGATTLSTVAFTGTNPVTYSIPATGAGSLSAATHSFTATYVPSGISFSTSVSAPRAYVVNPVLIPTTTVASATSGVNAYSSTTVTATVSPPAAAGTVTFTDSLQGNIGSSATVAGVATLTTTALGAGAHVITASFVATDPLTYGPSSGAAGSFSLASVGATPDPQAIQVIVAPGTLTITTPYNYDPILAPTAPKFLLGTMALDSTGTYLQASAPFGDATTPANGVTITDTRAGDVPWTASASANDFVTPAGDLIDAHGLGFTAVTPRYIALNALNALTKPVVTNDVPSYAPSNVLYPTTGLKGAPHQFATAVNGVGSVYVTGSLNLYAPTSTKAGTYLSTLTFTAV